MDSRRIRRGQMDSPTSKHYFPYSSNFTLFFMWVRCRFGALLAPGIRGPPTLRRAECQLRIPAAVPPSFWGWPVR